VLIKGAPCPAHYAAEKSIDTPNTHGTGCTQSAATAAYLARGHSPFEATRHAKDYITAALRYPWRLAAGMGPTDNFCL
jgi:hydroxymethylpyrimidine/phosphomethylpyrimidine kinase